ncbi:MAG: MFS transporter [Ilumatobacteraceae bacterium]
MGSSETVEERRISAWAPLRNRVFFALFVAQLVSNLGTLMQSVGAAWLVGDLGASSALIAMVQTATFLPVFLVGIPAGVLADVFDRRKLLIGAQSGMMLAATAMAVMTFSGSITTGVVLGLTFALGFGSALNIPAWQAIQPDLVPKEQFGQAVALGGMTYNVGRAIGPAIGGLVIASAGAGWVFAVNAISFAGTIAVLVVWRPSAGESSHVPAETFTGAAVAGIRYGFHSPLVRTVLVRVGLLMLPAAAFTALLPVLVRGPLQWGSGGFGFLLGCNGLGAAASALVRPRIVRRLPPDAVSAVAGVVLAAALIVQGFVHNRTAVAVSLVASGVGLALALIETTVAAQAAMPAWVRARGLSLYTLVMTGSVAVGSVVVGLVANRSLSGAYLVAAIVIGLGPLAIFRWPLTRSQEVDLTLVPGEVPMVALDPADNDGPVFVSVTYRVPSERLSEFGPLMALVEQHRRRTGGFRWGLYRDLAEPDRFVETFLVASWAEHLRQHHRTTVAGDEMLRGLRPFVDDHARTVGHFLSAASAGGMAPHVAGETQEEFTEEV